MITVDGAAGGGQLLRTALSLAAAREAPVRVTNVRGRRDTPGLRPQHLAGVRMFADLCGGPVEGDAVGSTEVTVDPAGAPEGTADAAIGTAGSIGLLFDVVAALGPAIEAPVTVHASGGTDVRWAPTMAYYRRVKCATLRRLGFDVSVEVGRHGFYPAGGGRATLTVRPTDPEPIRLTGRGEPASVSVASIESRHLHEADVAERQRVAAVERLEEAGVDPHSTAETVESEGPGSSVTVVGTFADAAIGASSLGERGRPAEEVGAAAAGAYLAAAGEPGAVDVHLADQLMVPLAIVGGRVSIPRVTDHVETNAEVVRSFGVDLEVDRGPDGAHLAVDGGILGPG